MRGPAHPAPRQRRTARVAEVLPTPHTAFHCDLAVGPRDRPPTRYDQVVEFREKCPPTLHTLGPAQRVERLFRPERREPGPVPRLPLRQLPPRIQLLRRVACTLTSRSNRSSPTSRTSDLSTSPCTASMGQKSSSASTASAASSVNPTSNADSCAKAACSSADSSSHDQSSVARSVACRSRRPPVDVSSRNRSPMRSSSFAGRMTRTRAAASSIASGSWSSKRTRGLGHSVCRRRTPWGVADSNHRSRVVLVGRFAGHGRSFCGRGPWIRSDGRMGRCRGRSAQLTVEESTARPNVPSASPGAGDRRFGLSHAWCVPLAAPESAWLSRGRCARA